MYGDHTKGDTMIKSKTIESETTEIRENVETGDLVFCTNVEITSEGLELLGDLSGIFDALKSKGYSYEKINAVLMDVYGIVADYSTRS